MPKRRKNKRKRRKKHKDNTQEANKNSNLKQVICAFFQNVLKKDLDVSELANVVLLKKYPDNVLSEMIELWCDPLLDSNKIDYYIEILIIIISTKTVNKSMKSILNSTAIELLRACFKQKRSLYIDDCMKWCLELTISFPPIINHFVFAFNTFLNKKHFPKLWVQYVKTRTKVAWNEIENYLRFTHGLFCSDIIPISCIYQILSTARAMSIVNTCIITVLYLLNHVCRISGVELFADNNNTLVSTISETYLMCTRCSICQCSPIIPVIIECDHIFCTECINNVIAYQKQTFSQSKPCCPQCAMVVDKKSCLLLRVPYIQEIIKMCTNSYWRKRQKFKHKKQRQLSVKNKDNTKLLSPLKIPTYSGIKSNNFNSSISKYVSPQENLEKLKDMEVSNEQKYILQRMEKLKIQCKHLEALVEKNKSEYNTKLEMVRNEVKLMKKRYDDSLNTWNKSVKKKQSDIDALNVKCTNLETSLQKSKSKKDKWKVKYSKLKWNHQQIIEEHKLANIVLSEKENEIDKLKTTCKNLKHSLQQNINEQQKVKQQHDENITEMQRECNNSIAEHKLTRHKINQLQITYDKLKAKYNDEHEKFSYLWWNASEIAKWISNIDKLRYEKYYNVLVKNMTNEGISGRYLHDLDKNDLHRLGIVSFADKCDILAAVRELIRHNHSVGQQSILVEKKEAKCIVCYEEIPTYVCIPCGHLNVCGNCKDKLTGTCPICQNEYESVIKVFHDF
eukprot:111127_1